MGSARAPRTKEAGEERALIFDVDGTLVDSNDAHAAAWAEALRDFGLGRPLGDIRRLIGVGGDKLLPALTGIHAHEARGRQIVARRAERFREAYLPRLRAFPGTRALFERLARDGIRLAIASSAKEQELSRLLEIAGVTDLVEHRTSADDVHASKPDPDSVQAALDQLGLEGGTAVMVGDTPYDLEAAHRAGVGALAVRCGGGWTDPELAGALAIYDGPGDMLAHYERDGWSWS